MVVRYTKYVKELKKQWDGFLEKDLQTKHATCCYECRNKIINDSRMLQSIIFKNIEANIRRNRDEYNKSKKKVCEICGINYNLHVHHIDGDRLNNKKENLETLCGNCHVLEHKKKS